MLRLRTQKHILKFFDSDKTIKGQLLMEFTFTMIVILLMFWGVMMIFRWTGMDLAERRIAHEMTLTGNINGRFGPQQQLDPYFYEPISMNAIWRGN